MGYGEGGSGAILGCKEPCAVPHQGSKVKERSWDKKHQAFSPSRTSTVEKPSICVRPEGGFTGDILEHYLDFSIWTWQFQPHSHVLFLQMTSVRGNWGFTPSFSEDSGPWTPGPCSVRGCYEIDLSSTERLANFIYWFVSLCVLIESIRGGQKGRIPRCPS